ncbi:MAG: heme ABC transporter ATP-binding protein [Polyangiaceae bacterium]
MIVARGVWARASGRWILRDVSCAVAPGEVLGVLGPNAAGKSTLFSLLTSELTPDSGDVTLNGTPLRAHSPRALARARGVVRQRSDVAFDLRVLDVVLLGRFCHAGRGDTRADVDAARRALADVDLSDLAERSYTHLSGGEQRRAQIARALAQVDADSADPASPPHRYLLLDEPLANLDMCHQLDILSLLRRKAREGLGVVVVLHELGLAARACDRLLVLHEGRAAREGPPADVLTPRLLQDVFRLRARVRRDASEGLSIDLLW